MEFSFQWTRMHQCCGNQNARAQEKGKQARFVRFKSKTQILKLEVHPFMHQDTMTEFGSVVISFPSTFQQLNSNSKFVSKKLLQQLWEKKPPTFQFWIEVACFCLKQMMGWNWFVWNSCCTVLLRYGLLTHTFTHHSDVMQKITPQTQTTQTIRNQCFQNKDIDQPTNSAHVQTHPYKIETFWVMPSKLDSSVTFSQISPVINHVIKWLRKQSSCPPRHAISYRDKQASFLLWSWTENLQDDKSAYQCRGLAASPDIYITPQSHLLDR